MAYVDIERAIRCNIYEMLLALNSPEVRDMLNNGCTVVLSWNDRDGKENKARIVA